jgi:hypothetical protein
MFGARYVVRSRVSTIGSRGCRRRRYVKPGRSEQVTTDVEKRKSKESFSRRRSSYEAGYEDGRRAVVRSLGFQTEAELKEFFKTLKAERGQA